MRSRRFVVPFVLGAAVVLAGLVLIGSRAADEPPSFALTAAEDGTTTLTGTVEGVEAYAFVLPEGVEATDPDAVVFSPTADAPVRWAVTVEVIPADGALEEVVDPADLRERLPAYGDGRSLLTDPRRIDVDGTQGWTHDILDVDGEPFVTRSVLVDLRGRRYGIGLAVPQADAEEWLDPLTTTVVDSWRWIG